MEGLRNKVVLITGATSGIGAFTAVEFAKYGSRLVLTGRNVDNLKKTSEHCQAQGLNLEKVLTVAGDVLCDEDLTRIVNMASSRFNGIDVLVNNAAIVLTEDLQSPCMDTLDVMYRTNLRAAVLLTKLVIPYLKKSKGSVVNVSSVTSTKPSVSICSYGMMKAALDMFTKDLALELAQSSVRVNSVHPGTIRTPMSEGFGLKSGSVEQYFREHAEIHPMGRVGLPQEVARAIVFLASECSSFTTGASLAVDGGVAETAIWTPTAVLKQP